MLFIFAWALSSSISAQQVDKYFKDTSFTNVKFKLINILRLNGDSDGNDSSIIISGLSNKFTYPLKFVDSPFIPGIYKFASSNDHSKEYLLFLFRDYFTIISNYEIQNVIKKYLSIVEELKFDQQMKLETLNNLMSFYKQRSFNKQH